MITGIIVTSTVAFGIAFTVAWLVRPDLRERIERPKYRFARDARRYDGSFGSNRDDGRIDRRSAP